MTAAIPPPNDSDTAFANRLTVREWRPTTGERGAFLLLHGMESHSVWWAETAARLVGRGWAVVAFDRSGWGTSGGQRGHLASYRDFVEETCGVLSTVRKRYGSLHLAGMSWGGMAAMYLALRRGWLLDSLAMLAPGFSSRNDVTFFAKCRVAVDFVRKKTSSLVQPVFRPEHFTSDPEWQAMIRDDPDRVRRVTTSFCIETLKMRRFCEEMAGKRQLSPTLCLLAEKDAILNNAVVGALSKKAGATVETIPNAAHTLIFEQPDLVAERLADHAAQAMDLRKQNEKTRRTVWVIGAGAVGGGLGALVSFSGHRVGMLVKEQYKETLQKNGLTLHAGHARRTTGGTCVFASSCEDLPGNPDLVLLAVKSFDTESALATLRPHITPNSVIATVQNGIGNESKIANALPNHTIIAGVIGASLEMITPGVIGWPDERGGLGGALYQGDAARAKQAWCDALQPTGLETRWYTEDRAAVRLKWSKLMLNIGFNALNSITGLPSAELLDHPVYGRLALQALREGFLEMKAHNLEPLDLPGFSVSKLALLVRAPLELARKVMRFEAARSTEASFSMRQDIMKNRQHTEIQELNGVITVLAIQRGKRAPANEKLIGMVENFQKIHSVSIKQHVF